MAAFPFDHQGAVRRRQALPALERHGQAEEPTSAVRLSEQYIGDVHLLGYAKLLGTLIGGGWHSGLRQAVLARRLPITW